MHTYDRITASGIHIHVSLNIDYNTCYVFVNDIYDNRLTMRFFTNMLDAANFIDQF